LARLRKRLKQPKEWPDVRWLEAGLSSEDVRTEAETLTLDARFRKAILEGQNCDTVAACISGGRKSMSGVLQQAMLLLARPQDFAFHVLLDPQAPDLKEFSAGGTGFAFPGDPIWERSRDMSILGVRVPLVRLRDLAQRWDLDFSQPGLVEALQTSVDSLSQWPVLELNLTTRDLWLLEGEGRRRLLRLSLRKALVWGAWMEAGEPVRLSAMRKGFERILPRLSFRDGDQRAEICTWVDEWSPLDHSGPTPDRRASFDQLVSNLNQELEGQIGHPQTALLFKLSSPRKQKGRAESDRPLAFDSRAYDLNLLKVLP
jgi:hypothetical protein